MQKLAKFFGVTPDALSGSAEVPHPQAQQIERIHRDLKDLTTRDRTIIEEMVRSMRSNSPAQE